MPSLTDITKQLEIAVAQVTVKKTAAEAAAKAHRDADEALSVVLKSVKDLHVQYQEHMSTILTNFGQLHK